MGLVSDQIRSSLLGEHLDSLSGEGRSEHLAWLRRNAPPATYDFVKELLTTLDFERSKARGRK